MVSQAPTPQSWYRVFSTDADITVTASGRTTVVAKAWVGLVTAWPGNSISSFDGTYTTTLGVGSNATVVFKSDGKAITRSDINYTPAQAPKIVTSSQSQSQSQPASTPPSTSPLSLPTSTTSSIPVSSSTPPTTGAPTAGNSPSSNVAAPTSIASNHSRLSGGVVAGVAIGCAAVGALIAALIFFFCLSKIRRRRKGYEPSPSYVMNDTLTSLAKGGASAVTNLSPPEGSAAAIVENHLPQPVEDKKITGGLDSLKTLINNHVLSYYHIAPSQEKASAQNLTRVLGNRSPIVADRLSAMLASPRTRPPAMRFVVAWIVLSRLGPDSDPATTFLPWQWLSVIQSMGNAGADDKVHGAFLSKWRTITSSLSAQTFGGNAIADNDPRNEHVRKALTDADSILKSYVNPREDNAARLRNLEEIMKRAVRFAYTLFSQPSTFRFDWQAGADSLATFPAMLQITDEAGAPLPAPHSFGEKEVARI